MLALTLLVVSIALADSINPSTVVPALYMAGRHGVRPLAGFVAGVFAAYLAGGLVLVLGPGPELIAALRHVGPQLEHVLEAGAGVVLLVVAIALWARRRTPPAEKPSKGAGSPRAALALGAGIAAIELPTAFIYFGAVSAILASRSGVAAQVLLVVAYNALFVLPLLAILAARALGPDVRLATAGDWLRRVGPIALSAVLAAGGAGLMSFGLDGMLSG